MKKILILLCAFNLIGCSVDEPTPAQVSDDSVVNDAKIEEKSAIVSAIENVTRVAEEMEASVVSDINNKKITVILPAIYVDNISFEEIVESISNSEYGFMEKAWYNIRDDKLLHTSKQLNDVAKSYNVADLVIELIVSDVNGITMARMVNDVLVEDAVIDTVNNK